MCIRFEDLKHRLVYLFKKMKKRGTSRCYICRQINKGFLRYPDFKTKKSVRFLGRIHKFTTEFYYF